MDPIYAMLSYDHHLDNGSQEPKTRQSRTGLGDGIVRSCSMCDARNPQSHGDCTCAPKCPSSTTSLSWVRPQIHIQIRLALLGISLYSLQSLLEILFWCSAVLFTSFNLFTSSPDPYSAQSHANNQSFLSSQEISRHLQTLNHPHHTSTLSSTAPPNIFWGIFE